DLTKMQVDTNVSESDVGAAKVGEKASFTVEAYPGRTFWGRVAQVREAPITVQNVVTYDVVVSVDNADFALLPGMTANTRIVTDERDDVLRVPVRALRFAPQGVGGTDRKGTGGTERKRKEAGAEGTVWVVRDGRPERVPVTSGLADGTFAEITGASLAAGDRVVVDEVAHENAARSTTPSSSSLARPHFHP
ncbi:MAG TPA: efflux RND transporter periplasmic adaptor subunit, partial [Candidatus Binatia bacterium]|nr:efflux RND transporter periplasmic adaptor subunit [Candidatus Binatia bacterium]